MKGNAGMTFDPGETPPDSEERLRQAAALLGEPIAAYRINPDRQLTKIILAVALIALGLTGLVLWFGFGPARVDHFILHFLIVPPMIGIGLLWHFWKHRGLRVMVYPHGILRLHGDAAESFPWDEITAIRCRFDLKSEPQCVLDRNGRVDAAWLDTSVPSVQVWNVWLEIERQDGATTRFTAALVDFPKFAREVQVETFPHLKARALQAIADKGVTSFSDLRITPHEIALGKTSVPWSDVMHVKIIGKILHVKRRGAWVTAIVKDASAIPNLHVLLGLVVEFGGPELITELDSDEDD